MERRRPTDLEGRYSQKQWAVNPELYYLDPTVKQPTIVYIGRQQYHLPELQRLLHSRNPAFVRNLQWRALGP